MSRKGRECSKCSYMFCTVNWNGCYHICIVRELAIDALSFIVSKSLVTDHIAEVIMAWIISVLRKLASSLYIEGKPFDNFKWFHGRIHSLFTF